MSANIPPSTPLSSPLTDKLPFQIFHKALDNRKCKILNFSLSLITLRFLILHCTIFYLFLNICKTFFIPKLFVLRHLSSVVYFFRFSKPFPGCVYLFKTMETWVCEICQICMKTSEQNLFNVNNKSTRTT